MNFNTIRKSEIFRYILVGGGAVCIDFLIYTLLSEFTQIDISWSKRISYVCGGIWSFFANKLFTFRKYELNTREPFLFILVYAIGFFLNSVLHDLVLKIFSVKLLAFSLATFISVVWNYIGQKWVVFRNK